GGRHVPAAPLRTHRPGRADLRPALRRPAGPLPDPPAGTPGRHRPAPRRADGQPRPGVGGGAPGGPGVVRGHGPGRHPRPLVRPLLRPVPGLRQRRPGPGDPGTRLGRTPGGTRPLSGAGHEGAPAARRPRELLLLTGPTVRTVGTGHFQRSRAPSPPTGASSSAARSGVSPVPPESRSVFRSPCVLRSRSAPTTS